MTRQRFNDILGWGLAIEGLILAGMVGWVYALTVLVEKITNEGMK